MNILAQLMFVTPGTPAARNASILKQIKLYLAQFIVILDYKYNGKTMPAEFNLVDQRMRTGSHGITMGKLSLQDSTVWTRLCNTISRMGL